MKNQDLIKAALTGILGAATIANASQALAAGKTTAKDSAQKKDPMVQCLHANDCHTQSDGSKDNSCAGSGFKKMTKSACEAMMKSQPDKNITVGPEVKN